MPLDRTEMIACVRADLGGLCGSDISDDLLNKAIDTALDCYSKHHPRLEDITVDVPANGLLDADPDVLMIVASSWGSSLNESIDVDNLLGFENARDHVASFAGFTGHDLRSLAMDEYLNQYEIEKVERQLPFEVRLNAGQYEFLPSPTGTSSSVNSAQLRVGRKHTDQTFPMRHTELLRMGAVARALEMVALARYKFTSIGGGSQRLNLRNPDGLLKLAERKWKSFKSSLGQARWVNQVGLD